MTTSTPPTQKHRFGLLGKLILAIVAVGTIPILVGLSVAYIKGNSQLREVIGESFQALAHDGALKVDGEIQRVIAIDRRIAQQAAADPDVRNALLTMQPTHASSSGANSQFHWPAAVDTGHTKLILRSSWVTGPGGGSARNSVDDQVGPGEEMMASISGLRRSGEINRYLFRISVPIQDPGDGVVLGWLHRDYDVKNLLDPLIYPIRFGETGHVMIIDNIGSIVSCPDLATGSSIGDGDLVSRVATNKAGWITAENDGHGGRKFSIIGHAPLAGLNRFLQSGASWHMFVWQDSREVFAPARSLMTGVTLAGLLAIALLGILGYYASSHIVKPIQRLRQEAAYIAGGDLDRNLDIRTRDEIEELADELNQMRVQLRQLIGNLEKKVEERTKELTVTQAEKDRVVQQLIHTEKVAAIGTMASGIGHEINNPLYAILGMAEAIRDNADIAQCREYSQDIIKHSKHIAEIVKDLSGYIRPAARSDLEPIDVNERLTEAIAMAKRTLLSDRVKITENLTPALRISAKPEEIQQAFFNIIRNGIQAMEGKGVLEINSRLEEGQVCIRIQDSGQGIPEDQLGRIFDPFFTTKGPDEGEGLGLYIVQQIVKKYDGSIAVDSQVGEGTVFTMQFPASE